MAGQSLQRAGRVGGGGGRRPCCARRALTVVDASVIVSALGDDGSDGERARQRRRGERLAAPHRLDLEVTSAWRRLAAAGGLDDRRAHLALADLRELRVDRVRHRPPLGAHGLCVLASWPGLGAFAPTRSTCRALRMPVEHPGLRAGRVRGWTAGGRRATPGRRRPRSCAQERRHAAALAAWPRPCGHACRRRSGRPRGFLEAASAATPRRGRDGSDVGGPTAGASGRRPRRPVASRRVDRAGPR